MSSGAPFGLRRVDGRIVPDPVETSVLREVVEAFLSSGGRMKTAAAALNARGLRTRKGSAWSDTAVARAIKLVARDGLVPDDLRQRCVALLEERSAASGAPGRRPVHFLGGVVFCNCTGRMYLLGTGLAGKFVCRACRAKIPVETLERVFQESLSSVEVTAAEIMEAFSDNPRAAELTRRLGGESLSISQVWAGLTSQERQLLVDVAVSRIVVDAERLTVIFGLEAHSAAETAAFPDRTLPSSYGSEASGNSATQQGNTPDRPRLSSNRPIEPPVPPAPEPKAYRIRRVAQLLSLPKSTVYDLVRTGTLSSVRTGRGGKGVVLVPASAVTEFLERRNQRR